MNAASQTPSGILISTFFSTTGSSAADTSPAAAARPAAMDIATNSRRDGSSGASAFAVWSFSLRAFFFRSSRSSATSNSLVRHGVLGQARLGGGLQVPARQLIAPFVRRLPQAFIGFLVERKRLIVGGMDQRAQ